MKFMLNLLHVNNWSIYEENEAWYRLSESPFNNYMRERKAEVIFDRQAQSTNTLWGWRWRTECWQRNHFSNNLNSTKSILEWNSIWYKQNKMTVRDASDNL